MDFFNEAKKHFEMMVSIRRRFHMYPEIDRDLTNTSNYIEEFLKSHSISYKRFINNGIVASIGKVQGKKIALRADMDALYIQDLKDTPYKSKREGIMHACGHDAHTAILMGVAVVLKGVEDSLNGCVKLIFQPAEETDGGARDMIEFGCLEGVEAIIGLHVDETLDINTIGIKKGVVCAASNPFEIRISGKGAHGAHPDTGIDAIMIAANTINNLQSIVSREISSLDNAVITVGKIQGGTTLNAICSEVIMEGILRTLGNDLRSFCKERIKKVVESTANMYRGEASVSFVEGYPSFSNDDNLYDKFIKMLNKETTPILIDVKKPSLTVEDFAYYTENVPGLYYKLGCKNIKKGIYHPAHGSYFDVDEECMIAGCAVQSMFAYKYLNDLIN